MLAQAPDDSYLADNGEWRLCNRFISSPTFHNIMISRVVDWKVAQSQDSFPALLFQGLAPGVLLHDFLLGGIDQESVGSSSDMTSCLSAFIMDL